MVAFPKTQEETKKINITRSDRNKRQSNAQDTPVPSKSFVRLQFTPRNPFSHAALNFTGRINVQYKIQRKQLRLRTHISAMPSTHI